MVPLASPSYSTLLPNPVFFPSPHMAFILVLVAFQRSSGQHGSLMNRCLEKGVLHQPTYSAFTQLVNLLPQLCQPAKQWAYGNYDAFRQTTGRTGKGILSICHLAQSLGACPRLGTMRSLNVDHRALRGSWEVYRYLGRHRPKKTCSATRRTDTPR